jgi:hypothetical protein
MSEVGTDLLVRVSEPDRRVELGVAADAVEDECCGTIGISVGNLM